MKLRTLVIAVALLALLSVIAYLKDRPEPEAPSDPRVGKAILDPDTVSRASAIEIADQGQKIELTRDGDGTWRVPSYYGFPADFEKISRLAQDLNEAKVDRIVTSSPERLAHLGFTDSSIVLSDSAGREIWSLTLGKTPDSGNGRFIRFGKEPVAFFSGMHVWLDTDAKGWADARLVTVKPDAVGGIAIPFDGDSALDVSRGKKEAPWAATAPAGKELSSDKVTALLTTLTSLRFSDTVDLNDPSAAAAAAHMRTFKLTTFDGKTLTISLGRKPEEKKAKAPAPETKDASAAKPADAKPVAPEFETVPAGPVFAVVTSSDPHAPINDMMKRRAFQVEEYTFTGLPQKADEMFEAKKGK